MRYVKDTTPTPTTIRRLEYTYDDAGNRASQKDIPATGTAKLWVYEYDYLDRLAKVSLDTEPVATAANLSVANAQTQRMYAYDAADNRTELNMVNINEILTYSYDDADNITERFLDTGSGPVSIETFTSDDDGNMLTRVSGGVTTTYTWSDFNRLASISTSDNSKTQEHTFGVNGFRRKKKDKNNVETTEYAGGLATAVSKSTAETVTYLMAHGLVGFERSSDGKMFYFLTDALSSVRDVVDDAGSVKASYEFSEYGAKISPPNTNGVESDKTFVGGLSVQDEVADTGLMMMGHRFYDESGGGRFINRDPIGFSGGLNLMEYSRSSPITHTDASGLVPEPGQGRFFNGGDLMPAPRFKAGPRPELSPQEETILAGSIFGIFGGAIGLKAIEPTILNLFFTKPIEVTLAGGIGLEIVGGAVTGGEAGPMPLLPAGAVKGATSACGSISKWLDIHGRLTTGKYTINPLAMIPHINGVFSNGRSQFFHRVDASSILLDAAHFADRFNLWNARNKAKVLVDIEIGSTGRGIVTDVVNVYRKNGGSIHGSPGN